MNHPFGTLFALDIRSCFYCDSGCYFYGVTSTIRPCWHTPDWGIYMLPWEMFHSCVWFDCQRDITIRSVESRMWSRLRSGYILYLKYAGGIRYVTERHKGSDFSGNLAQLFQPRSSGKRLDIWAGIQPYKDSDSKPDAGGIETLISVPKYNIMNRTPQQRRFIYAVVFMLFVSLNYWRTTTPYV